MGLTSRLLTDLSQGLLSGERGSTYFELAEAEPMLKNTTSLFVDLTQLLYGIKVSPDKVKSRRVVEHRTASSFLQSNDPMGELQFEEGHIFNMVDTFSMDQVVQVVINRVMTVKRQWKIACNSVGITCPMKTMFLFLDGDSPVAKYSTVKERVASKQSCITNKILRIVSSEPAGGIRPSREEIEKCIASKMARSGLPTEAWDGPTYEGSVKHFLQKRTNQHRVATELAEVLSASHSPLVQDVSLYLVMGRSREMPSGQCVKLCGTYNHPCDTLLGECIPYKEADLLVPFVWTKISPWENQGCIVSRDSDALVTMLALADPKLSLLVKVKEAPSKYTIFKGNVALRAGDHLSRGPHRQLEAMLHLTMGGTDYVETYPRCGPVTILKGLENLEGISPVFANVRFAKWSEVSVSPPVGVRSRDDPVLFRMSRLKQGSHHLSALKELARSREDSFPIRLGNAVYLVLYDCRRDVRPREWYAKQCPARIEKVMTETQRRHFQNDRFVTAFSYAMRRRLFFLSMMSDSRACMENDMEECGKLSAKCGYSSIGIFSYANPMVLTAVNQETEKEDGEQL